MVEELKQELPRVVQFATLSPVPGFRRWLEGHDNEAALDAESIAALDDPATWEAPEASAAFEEPLPGFAPVILPSRNPGVARTIRWLGSIWATGRALSGSTGVAMSRRAACSSRMA